MNNILKTEFAFIIRGNTPDARIHILELLKENEIQFHELNHFSDAIGLERLSSILPVVARKDSPTDYEAISNCKCKIILQDNIIAGRLERCTPRVVGHAAEFDQPTQVRRIEQLEPGELVKKRPRRKGQSSPMVGSAVSSRYCLPRSPPAKSATRRVSKSTHVSPHTITIAGIQVLMPNPNSSFINFINDDLWSFDNIKSEFEANSSARGS
jgi:hypothetical protein